MFKQAIIEIMPDKYYHRYLIKKNEEYWCKHDKIFIHIPKNAGWSVSHELYGKFLGHIPVNSILKYRNRNNIKKEFYGIYRDPVKRFISAVNYSRLGSSQSASSFRYFGSKYYTQCSIDLLLDRLMSSKETSIDPVFQSQSFYCLDQSGNQSVLLSSIEKYTNHTKKNVSVINDNISEEIFGNDKIFNKVKNLYAKDFELDIQ